MAGGAAGAVRRRGADNLKMSGGGGERPHPALIAPATR